VSALLQNHRQSQNQAQRQRTGVSVPHEPWRGQQVPHRAFSPVRNDKELGWACVLCAVGGVWAFSPVRFLGSMRHDRKSCPSRSCSKRGAGVASTSCRGWRRRVAGGGVDELHRSLVGSRPLRERLRCLRMTAAADRNPMGLRVVESHPSQSTRRMGHPGLSQNQGQDQSQRQRTGVSVPHEPWRGQRVPHRAFSPVRNDKDLE
jgi:hypothetical protein